MRFPRNSAALALWIFGWVPLFAQPKAVLMDGPGPWVDTNWTFAVGELRSLLTDAGYAVQTVAPENIGGALTSADVLLAAPSLEMLPLATLNAVSSHVSRGGMLMATGGQPFKTPLYGAPDGRWVNAAEYQQTTGKAATVLLVPSIPMMSPSSQQYVNSAGLRMAAPRGRKLFSTSGGNGYSVIGDLVSPAVTFVSGVGAAFAPPTPGSPGIQFVPRRSFTAWLPWPKLAEPHRGQLVTELKRVWRQASLISAGVDQLVWLPGQKITGAASVFNIFSSSGTVRVEWTLTGSATVAPPSPVEVTVDPLKGQKIPFEITGVPNGEYRIRTRLLVDGQVVDETEGPFRVLNPVASRQPDQKIRVKDGHFEVAGKPVFLRGINYWPRYVTANGSLNGGTWFLTAVYDPDVVEADLAQIESLGFNLVSVQYQDVPGNWAQEAPQVIDFLERCRNHHLWVQFAIAVSRTNSAYAGQLSPNLEQYLQSAFLPGNDRVFSYDLLWEPSIGLHEKGGQGRLVNGAIVYDKGRLVLDPDWRAWIDEQYGSLGEAEKAWGIVAPRDAQGLVTNPLDDQIRNDGPWRVFVAAYRRFLDDYIGRNLGLIARRMRRTDPDTLLTYRNWTTMTAAHNESTGYDIGAGAAYLDFVSPERYTPTIWPESRSSGLVTAYGKYRSGGKPVFWAEFGADIGLNGGTEDSRAWQTSICEAMMRQVSEDGSSGTAVWWWPGGKAPTENIDFGMIDPDGTPRGCLTTLAQFNQTFATAPQETTGRLVTVLNVDRDGDARGSYGVFVNNADRYVQAKQSEQGVLLTDDGANTDTATMPLVQVGNIAYSGSGPLKWANADIAGIHVVCPNLDVIVENGSTLAVAPGAGCQAAVTVTNSGTAKWLASGATRGVTMHTSFGDVGVAASVASLTQVTLAPVSFTMGQSSITWTGRMNIAGVGSFGETLSLTLTASNDCTITATPSGVIQVPAGGASGSLTVKTGANCSWSAAADQTWVTLSTGSGTGNGTVSYTVPAAYGPQRQATITIGSSAFRVVQESAVTSPLVAAPVLSATALTFAKQTVGTVSAVQTVQVMNPGPGILNLGSVSVGGPENAEFTLSSDCDATLNVGQQCSVRVAFTPASSGMRSATLYVTGNLSQGSIPVQLSGTGEVTAAVPVVQAIVDAWGYTSGIAPGLWVVIGGTNLAGPAQVWNLDGVTVLPRALGSTSVTFNGTPATLLYVSPTQVNALVPASVAPGPVEVIVTVNGVPSAPFGMTARAAQPAVYAPPSVDGSAFYVTAALAGTGTLIGNSTTDSRVLRGARPGESLDFYMIGLGATADGTKFVTDRVFGGAFPLSAPVNVTIGGRTANVVFAGLTSPGLYLVRIEVPGALSAGDQGVEVSMGEARSRPGLFLTVAAP